VSESEQRLCVP